MTHHPIKTLPDGTRVYSNGTRYRPKAAAERVNRVNKPDDPRAFRIGGRWFIPTDVLPDAARVMPLTRPDSEAALHAARRPRCRCEVCSRPEALVWRDKGQRGVGAGGQQDPLP